MRKITIALAFILGLNMVSAMINLSAPLSLAQESPAPEPEPKPAPEPEPKPEKPGE
jgi:hypothetical protein